MTGFIITPRDPLVVRDGRPNDGRSQSRTLSFPYPSTVAGLCRTRLGSNEEGRFLAFERLDELMAVEIRGPLLASPASLTPLAPAPRDAVLTRSSRNGRVYLRPIYPIEARGASFDPSLEEGMLPMGQEPEDVVGGKPTDGAPRWWPWTRLVGWLTGRPDVVRAEGERLEDILPGGVADFPKEARTHVALDPSGVAREGMLFGTAGLRLVGAHHEELALLVDVASTSVPEELRNGVGPGFGERRLLRWERGEHWAVLDDIPREVRDAVRGEGRATVRVRAVLLTPGHFEAGWKPGAPSPLMRGGLARLIAAVVPRPETLSGWDFKTRRPKSSRRLVSAGSVFVLELEGTPDDRERWLEEVWMKNVSDDLQSRRDGFGLCAVGRCLGGPRGEK